MELLKIKLSEKAVWLLLTILIIPSFISIMRPGFYSMHDDLQAFRLHQMDKCFQDFQIPCRWIPDMGYQYGYPQYNFYPPSVYYIGQIIHLLGFQFIDSVKVLVALGFLFSAYFMFLFLKDLLNMQSAFIGSLLYTYAPYKSVDVYVRGALSEFWALVFFPLIFWSVYKIVNEDNKKYIAFFAISVGLLLLTHNLMTFIFIPLSLIWAGLLLYQSKKWKKARQIILGGLLGLGLAAFFTIPVFVEKKYVHLDSIISGYFDYRMHFADLNQLFISNYWGYGSSVWGPWDEISLTTGQIHWMVGLLSLILAIFLYKKQKKIALAIFTLAILEFWVLFMTHSRSIFIWQAFEGVMAYIQFPWRFLGNSIFLLSIMGAVAVYFANLINKKLSIILSLSIILALFYLYQPIFQPHSWSNITDKEKFSGQLWEKQLTISIFDYLPIYAKLPPPSKAPDFPEVMDGKAEFVSYNKRSNFQYGQIKVLERSNIRLPLFDFPGMQVIVDGKKVGYWNDDCRSQKYCLGLISFDIEPGFHNIRVQLKDTPIRAITNLISLISVFITLGILIKSYKIPRRINHGNNKI